jgi:hypothetical protein
LQYQVQGHLFWVASYTVCKQFGFKLNPSLPRSPVYLRCLFLVVLGVTFLIPYSPACAPFLLRSWPVITSLQIMYNSRKMHKPKDKWRSREYGFIDYASPDEAAKAIVWMDGVELPDLMKDTCGIIVQYAKPTGSGEPNAAAAASSAS